MQTINNGVYPTMITPYTRENTIDYDAVEQIVHWYVTNGCDGIFAVCQSSEMNYLSLKERVMLAEKIVKYVKNTNSKVSVVASGHVSNDIAGQAEEVCAISETGIEAFVLVSNRLDLHNDGDRVWLYNAEKLLNKIPANIKLGIYECPTPYKRILSEEILDWCRKSKRFCFIKDTCCDPVRLKRRLEVLKGTEMKLFNANTQTLLFSLANGAAGYSGVMANFHPDLYVWLCKNYGAQPEKAESLQEILTLYAFEEGMHYPINAKYHMNLCGVKMELDSRSCDKKSMGIYEKMIAEQGFRLEQKLRTWTTDGNRG